VLLSKTNFANYPDLKGRRTGCFIGKIDIDGLMDKTYNHSYQMSVKKTAKVMMRTIALFYHFFVLFAQHGQVR